MDLALFDFDGTITTRGTYPGFVRYAVRPHRQLVGGVVLSPLIAGYQVRLVSDRTIRRVISRVGFQGEDPARLRLRGEEYAECVLPGLVRPAARERMTWHQARGDRVVVVSASLDLYLEPWCRRAGVDVICTQLEVRAGRFTGRYLGGDCCGATKATRIQERCALGDYGTVYAYGDSEEDREMLDLADRRFFRWQEVEEVPPVSWATRRGDGGT